MLDRRKKGKPPGSRAGIVPEGLPVFDALERAGLVVVMGAKPRAKPATPPRPKPRRPR